MHWMRRWKYGSSEWPTSVPRPPASATINRREATILGLVGAGGIGMADGRISEIDERDFTERFQQLQEKYGIDEGDEDFHIDNAPDEYKALNDEYSSMAARVFAMVCRELGESRIAKLYEQDRGEFDRRREEGREAVYGTVDPAVVELLVEKVDQALASEDDDAEPEGT